VDDRAPPPPRGRRWPVILAGIAVLGAIVANEWRAGRMVPAPMPAEPVPAPARPVPAPAARPAAATPPALPVRSDRTEDRVAALRMRLAASSLRGTTPDGELRLDAAGNLVRDAGLRRLFDYWLTLDGEFDDDELRALLRAAVADSHGDAVASQAMAAFERYLGLRSQLAAAPPEGALEQRLRRLQEARRAWFGTDAEAMFGEEEAQVRYTLDRQRIERADLPDAERAAQLAALEAGRPAAEHVAEFDATSAALAVEQTRQLDADRADAATRRAERTGLWGREAADRLAALDAQRAQWDGRVAAFARERERLLADPALEPAARERAVASALQRGFDEAERARIEAMLRTGTLPPGG
jgi:lipase chaperone LimK